MGGVGADAGGVVALAFLGIDHTQNALATRGGNPHPSLPIFVDGTDLVFSQSIFRIDVEWDDGQTRKFIQRVLESSAVTLGSLKLLATGLALTGIGLPLAVTMNGILNAVITLGLGRAAKRYFESGGEASDSEVYDTFMKTVGLSGLKDVVKMVRDEAKKVVESDAEDVAETEETQEV